MTVKDCRKGLIYTFPDGDVGMFTETDYGAPVFDINGRDWVAGRPNDPIRRATVREERDWYKGKWEGEW